jgi:hypothetical protein
MPQAVKGGFAPLYFSAFLVAVSSAANPAPESVTFDAFERTIPEIQAAMARGETTAEELVRQYLARIEAFDHSGPQLNAMIHINPRAIEEAAALDRERAAGNIRGPLHGIPVLLKDNYDTQDMPTTAGAIAMAGFVPKDDAYQVRRLREAGAVFIGKTNLHEFARGIETISSLGGQTLNPYDPELARRSIPTTRSGIPVAQVAGRPRLWPRISLRLAWAATPADQFVYLPPITIFLVFA